MSHPSGKDFRITLRCLTGIEYLWGRNWPESEQHKTTVISRLSSNPTRLTCVQHSAAMVQSLVGTSFVAIWSEFNINAGGTE